MFRTPAPVRHLAALALSAGLAAGAVLTAAPAHAGGAGPRPGDVHFVAEYLGCVDDEVDEPGTDGRAMVRVRLTHDVLSGVEVLDGGWGVTRDGEVLAEAAYPAPAVVPDGATWEQVVLVPGDTGPAQFRSVVTLAIVDQPGAAAFSLDPPVDLPGDCPQPGDEVPPTTEEEPPATVRPDVVVATPRFTG